MTRELIDWSGFRDSMGAAVRGLIGTKEAIENVQRAFQALQTAFQGEFPCILALMLEDSETWASNMVMTGQVRIVMDANRLVTSVQQDDPEASFVVKDEFEGPQRVQVVLLEPDTHEVAYRFPSITTIRPGDSIQVLDGADAP